MGERLQNLGAITLFVEDLDGAKTFYRDVVGLESVAQRIVSRTAA